MDDSLKKISAKTAYEVCRHFSLSEDAAAHLDPSISPADFLMQLEKNNLFEDAIRMLAHALPKRLAIWWACLVAELVTPVSPNSIHYHAYKAVEAWVRNPTETNRRIAEKAGAVADYKSAASWAATAAFWCTGSIGAEGDPMVAPPDYLYTHAIVGAIGLAAVTPVPDHYEENLQAYYYLGIDLAKGGSGKPKLSAAAS